MTEKRAQDEKLTEELYERLWWYTYEATEEEFNEREVDAIVRLLDELEPVREDKTFEPGAEAAFERFKSRYGLEEAFDESGEASGTEAEETAMRETAAEVVPMEGKAAEEAATDVALMEGKAAKKGGKSGRRKYRWLVRLGTAAAACVVLMFTVNLGSYALKKKSFFEVVREEMGRVKVTVTGNMDELASDDSEPVPCDSWEEAEKLVGEKLLRPTYLPEGCELAEISVTEMDTKKTVFAMYRVQEKKIRIEISVFPGNYLQNIISHDDTWTLIKEEEEGKKARYYQKGEQLESMFAYGTALYNVLGDISLDEMEKIILAME